MIAVESKEAIESSVADFFLDGGAAAELYCCAIVAVANAAPAASIAEGEGDLIDVSGVGRGPARLRTVVVEDPTFVVVVVAATAAGLFTRVATNLFVGCTFFAGSSFTALFIMEDAGVAAGDEDEGDDEGSSMVRFDSLNFSCSALFALSFAPAISSFESCASAGSFRTVAVDVSDETVWNMLVEGE